MPRVDVVRRSLLTLRLLTDEDTGGIVAAPTTSLPEDPGGERNWDYRFCWLRDAALTIGALIRAGHVDEAQLWRAWLLRAIAGRPRRPPDHVRRRRRPPADRGDPPAPARLRRVDAGADRQRRGPAAPARRARRGDDRRSSRPGRRPATPTATRGRCSARWSSSLADTWRRKDHGLWEIRGPQQRFTHSQAMVWAAFDRAVRAVEEFDLDGTVDQWRSAARQGPGRGARPGLRRRAQHVRAVLRQHRGRRRPAGAPPDRDRGGRRPADARHHRGGRARPDARRPAAALPHPDRRRRPLRRRAPVPGLLLLAGLGVRRRRPARRRHGPLRPALRPDQRRRPALGGVRRRPGAGWWATSRRRSATWPWCTPRSTSPRPASDADPPLDVREGRVGVGAATS